MAHKPDQNNIVIRVLHIDLEPFIFILYSLQGLRLEGYSNGNATI